MIVFKTEEDLEIERNVIVFNVDTLKKIIILVRAPWFKQTIICPRVRGDRPGLEEPV